MLHSEMFIALELSASIGSQYPKIIDWSPKGSYIMTLCFGSVGRNQESLWWSEVENTLLIQAKA